MVPFSALSAVTAALLVPNAGGASAAPAFVVSPLQFEEPQFEPFRWSNPAAIDARPRERGIFANAGFYYGDYRGRKLEMEEVLVGGAFTPNISAWFSHQDVLLKGRARTSRFDYTAKTYGARWVVVPPKEEDGRSLAIEFETVRPDNAHARTVNSAATYVATKNNTFAVTGYLGKDLNVQAAFSRIEGVNGEKGDVIAFVAAKDFRAGDRLMFRAQAHAVGQRVRGSVEDVDFEIKPVVFLAAGYRLAKGVRLETDLTFMPSGTPLAVGRLTSLTGFQIYRPGGPAAGLRSDAFGVGALRLVVHKAF